MKKLTAEQIEASAWAAALAAPLAEDKVPRGWLTTKEIAAKLGKSRERTSAMLRAALDAGKCEMRLFRIPAAGSSRPVPHYKLK